MEICLCAVVRTVVVVVAIVVFVNVLMGFGTNHFVIFVVFSGSDAAVCLIQRILCNQSGWLKLRDPRQRYLTGPDTANRRLARAVTRKEWKDVVARCGLVSNAEDAGH